MPEAISDEESLRLLREFLRRLEKLLDELTRYPRRALPGRYHESMQAAWIEVKPKFQDVINQLQWDATNTQTIVSNLKSRGLTGPQLVFKLTVFQHVHDALIDHGTPEVGQQKKRRWWQRWRRLFKPTMKAADVILGSLASVIHAAELIKEYKETVETGVEAGEAVAD